MDLVQTSSLQCLVALPSPRQANAPVLCFLHGYDEAAPTPIGDALTRHGPLHPAAVRWTQERFIIVAPQLPTRGDIWHRYAETVHAIVDDVHRQHGGDRNRTYLTGFSFGGNGVFDLALQHPVVWAALWAVDPTRVPPSDPGPPVWLSFGEVSRHYHERFVRLLSLKSAAEATDGPRLWLDEGADHVGSARRAYGDGRIYDWLLRQALPPSPYPQGNADPAAS